MAALNDRTAREEEIQAAIARLSDREREKIMEHIGNPPDPSKIPESVWNNIERDRRAALVVILLSIFRDSAAQHGLEGEYAETLGYEWANGRARWVAGNYVRVSRERIETIADEHNARLEQIRQAEADGQPAARIADDGASLAGDLEARIEQEVAGAARDERMAITETTAATTRGSELAAEAIFGISSEDTWRIADGDACDFCTELDGQPREVWEVECPNGPEDAHPECRCWIEYQGELAAV